MVDVGTIVRDGLLADMGQYGTPTRDTASETRGQPIRFISSYPGRPTFAAVVASSFRRYSYLILMVTHNRASNCLERAQALEFTHIRDRSSAALDMASCRHIAGLEIQVINPIDGPQASQP